MSDLVLTDLQDGVLLIQMNRPEKKNALVEAMYEALYQAIESADQDDRVRVLMFTGSGDSFAAGNDLQDFIENPPNGEDSPTWKFMLALAKTDLPIVAAVNGVAIGVGTTLLLHCDQVFASHKVKFGMPFLNLGIVPEAGSTLLLPRCAGYQKAAQLLLLGEPFNAQEAFDAGIVGHLVNEDEVFETAMATAKKLAGKPRSALRTTKRLLKDTSEPLLDRINTEARAVEEYLKSPAAKEAMTAFLEGRRVDKSKFD